MESVWKTKDNRINSDCILETSQLLDEIEELEAQLKLPTSLKLPQTPLGKLYASHK